MSFCIGNMLFERISQNRKTLKVFTNWSNLIGVIRWIGGGYSFVPENTSPINRQTLMNIIKVIESYDLGGA